MTLFKLYIIFVKIGAVLLGGGYVILPILQHEFTEKRELISKDTLFDYYAISQSLPGLIAANISMFIGYYLAGKRGAVCAMLGIISVPVLCIISLASILGLMLENSLVKGIMWGVGVAVIALIMLTIREMWQKSTKDSFFYILFLLSLGSLLLLKLSPIQVIIMFGALGLVIKMIIRKANVK